MTPRSCRATSACSPSTPAANPSGWPSTTTAAGTSWTCPWSRYEVFREVLLPPLLISNVVVQLLSQCQDPDYRPVLAIHHKLRRDNMHIYDELSTDKFFR